METVLEINDLSKRYGANLAIESLNFQVPKGSVFGILGPNGSGKTTTLGIVLNVLNASAGSFHWFGSSENPSKSLKRVGAILETPNFYPYMSGTSNLKIVADIKNCDPKRIPEVLELVNLYERGKDKFKTYSLGMKQRLAIASALLNDPEVLVLDEPTNGLDPQGIAEIRELILNISQQGQTIIIASHLLDEIEKVCTDVVVLKKGNLLFQGKVNELSVGNEEILIEVASKDLKELSEILQTYPSVLEVKPNDSKTLLVKAKANLTTQELNEFLFSQGIIVSHLVLKPKSLETQFLELTA